jgi:tRNA(fMet)-specific endonuclease VapC
VTRILLDTSAYSAFMRGSREAKRALQLCDEIRLNVIVQGELLAGFRKGRRAAENIEELRRFLASPRVDILGLDEATAELYAVILNTLWKAGTPIPTNDIWIAASAMQHGLRVLTNDPHFELVPQVLVERIDAADD